LDRRGLLVGLLTHEAQPYVDPSLLVAEPSLLVAEPSLLVAEPSLGVDQRLRMVTG
jgi:hypothetical protein